MTGSLALLMDRGDSPDQGARGQGRGQARRAGRSGPESVNTNLMQDEQRTALGPVPPSGTAKHFVP